MTHAEEVSRIKRVSADEDSNRDKKMLEFPLGHVLDTAIETWHEEEQHKVGREEPILRTPNGEQGIEPRLERDRIAEAEMREEQHRDSPKHCRYP